MQLATRFPQLELMVFSTDVDATLLERARRGCYNEGSLKALPAAWRELAFEREGKLFCLREGWRHGVEFERQDLLTALPQATFDLVLCRNMAFTYFAPEQARAGLERLVTRLRFGGALVIGDQRAAAGNVRTGAVARLPRGLPAHAPGKSDAHRPPHRRRSAGRPRRKGWLHPDAGRGPRGQSPSGA